MISAHDEICFSCSSIAQLLDETTASASPGDTILGARRRSA
jgi:hypothetical protein